MNNLKRYSVLLHITGWIIFSIIPLMALPFNNIFSSPNYKVFIYQQLFSTVLLIMVFYINLHVITPNYLNAKKSWYFLGFFTLGLCLVLVINSVAYEFLFKPHFKHFFFPKTSMRFNNGKPIQPPSRLFNPRYFGIFFSYLLSVIASSMLALVYERTRSKEENQQMLLEKTAAELAVLKLQVSPHFLFNTLNNIRWLARQKSEMTEDAVVKLSQLLRYMIYQSGNDKVSLDHEIEHLRNYIDLQKMRLTEKNSVDFICEGDTSQIMIEPLLFIPFVENAFKYGLHNQEKSDILTGIRVTKNEIWFYAENMIHGSNMLLADENSGIGILNVERRLALHYPDLHELHIRNAEGKFRVDLKIKTT
ncbi:MAG: sensor histidine kinase [Emticicia sp.]|uniref:sensor histidine kinase n=1 Tax=Emticicia sp. TaxID=1930953 RepID=UPI003BA83536